MSQVDFIALSRTEKEVATELVLLQQALGGQEPDDAFWASVVGSAYKLFKVGGVEEGFRVLAIVPPGYIRGRMVEQMESDPALAEKAKLIADCLLEVGRARLPRYYFDTTKHLPQRQQGVA